MSILDSYKTIEESSSAELKILNSKFIAYAFPVSAQSEITQRISEVRKKHFDAAHFPYAYRTGTEGNNFKSSDDGEPSGTAGKPLLEVIDRNNLTNVLIIVARYFGGTKLGTGGLRRAFHESALNCIESTRIVEKFITERIRIETDYVFMNSIMKHIESNKLRLAENNCDDKCRLTIEVRISETENLKKAIVDMTNAKVRFDDIA